MTSEDKLVVQNFISSLGNIENFEFCQGVWKPETLENLNLNEDCYFVGETNSKMIRAEKENIINKGYIVVDFDIREQWKKIEGEVVSDDVIKGDCVEAFKMMVEDNELLKDWRYIIFSGNGLHVYYTGKFKYNLQTYEDGVSEVYKQIDAAMDNPIMVCDNVCRTVNRILRVPMSTNTKRQKKHNLPNEKCEILFTQDVDSKIFKKLPELANKYKTDLAIEDVKKMESIEKKNNKSNSNIYDEICQIDLGDIVCNYTGLQQHRDGKNFKSDKDGSNVGMFLDNNILINFGTHHISDRHKGYNTFSFVKEHYKLNSSQAFEWFVEQYSHIKDMDQKNKEEWKTSQEESDKPIVNNWKDYCLSYGELLDRTLDYRRSIDRDNLCTYGSPGLDSFMQGILPEELVVLAAATGCGKSEISYNIATANALKGKKVMLFALEGSLEEIAVRHLQRLISQRQSDNNVPYNERIKTVDYRFNGKAFRTEEDLAKQSISESIKNNLVIYNKTAKTTMAFVKEMIINARNDVDLFLIDHLHYITLTSPNENREIGEIVRELKLITDTLKIPVVLVSHLRKPPGGSISHKPTEYDLHGSSNIAKEATTILLIYKSEEYQTDIADGETHLKETGFSCPKSRAGLGKFGFFGVYNTRTKSYEEDKRIIDEDCNVSLEDLTPREFDI